LEGFLIAGGDLGRCLPLVEGEAHRNPFFECDIAHANSTLKRGPNQVNVLGSYITYIFRKWWGCRDVNTMHDERTFFETVVEGKSIGGNL